jgi:hypothetical protein
VLPPPDELPLPFDEPPVPPTEIPVPVEVDDVGWELPILVPLLGLGWLGARTEVTGAAGAGLLGAGCAAPLLGAEPVPPPLLAT